MPQNNQGVSLIDLAVAPSLDFDQFTNRVILHAHQLSLTKWGHPYNNCIMSNFTFTRDYTIYSFDSRTILSQLKER